MARCMKNEKMGRPIFYGAMITEGVVALIWATVSMYFFYYGGWRECVSPEVAQQFIAQFDGGKSLIQNFDAPTVVKIVCSSWLGVAGGILALLGVVAAPITSGDTALRSARLIIAEFIGLEQRSMRKRLYICVPLFALTVGILVWQMENPDGFNIIWQYFGWANQTLLCSLSDIDGLSGTAEEAFCDDAGSCLVYDRDMLNLPAHFANSFGFG